MVIVWHLWLTRRVTTEDEKHLLLPALHLSYDHDDDPEVADLIYMHRDNRRKIWGASGKNTCENHNTFNEKNVNATALATPLPPAGSTRIVRPAGLTSTMSLLYCFSCPHHLAMHLAATYDECTGMAGTCSRHGQGQERNVYIVISQFFSVRYWGSSCSSYIAYTFP